MMTCLELARILSQWGNREVVVYDCGTDRMQDVALLVQPRLVVFKITESIGNEPTEWLEEVLPKGVSCEES